MFDLKTRTSRATAFLLIGAADLTIGQMIGWEWPRDVWFTTWPILVITPLAALLHTIAAVKLFPESQDDKDNG